MKLKKTLLMLSFLIIITLSYLSVQAVTYEELRNSVLYGLLEYLEDPATSPLSANEIVDLAVFYDSIEPPAGPETDFSLTGSGTISGNNLENMYNRVVTQTGTGTATGNSQLTCTEGWKCKTPGVRAMQKADCSWEQITNCQYGCLLGVCKDTSVDPSGCQSECSEGATRCVGTTSVLKTCVRDFDDDPCSEWNDGTTCEFGCQAGSCLNESGEIPCENECSAMSGPACNGNVIEECGQFDADNCLDLKQKTCSEERGCDNNTNECGPTCPEGWYCSGDFKVVKYPEPSEMYPGLFMCLEREETKERCPYGCTDGECNPTDPNCPSGDCTPPQASFERLGPIYPESPNVVLTVFAADNEQLKEVKFEYYSSRRWTEIGTVQFSENTYDSSRQAYKFEINFNPYNEQRLENSDSPRVKANVSDITGNSVITTMFLRKIPAEKREGPCATEGKAPGYGYSDCCIGLEELPNPLYGTVPEANNNIFYPTTCQPECTDESGSRVGGYCPLVSEYTRFPLRETDSINKFHLDSNWEHTVQWPSAYSDSSEGPIGTYALYRKAISDGVLPYSIEGVEAGMYWYSMGNIKRREENPQVQAWFDDWQKFVARWRYQNEGIEQRVGYWEFFIPDIDANMKIFDISTGARSLDSSIFYLEENQQNYLVKVQNTMLEADEFENCVIGVVPSSGYNWPYTEQGDYTDYSASISSDGLFWEATIPFTNEGWFKYRIFCNTVMTGQPELGFASFPIRRTKDLGTMPCFTSSTTMLYNGKVEELGVYNTETKTFEPTSHSIYTFYGRLGQIYVKSAATADFMPGMEANIPTPEYPDWSLSLDRFHTTVTYEEMAGSVDKASDIVSDINSEFRDVPLNSWGTDHGMFIPGFHYDAEQDDVVDEWGFPLVFTDSRDRVWVFRPITQAEVDGFKASNEWACALAEERSDVACWDEIPNYTGEMGFFDRIYEIKSGKMGLDSNGDVRIFGLGSYDWKKDMIKDGFILRNCDGELLW